MEEDNFEFVDELKPDEGQANVDVGVGEIRKQQYKGVCQTCKQIKYQLSQITFDLNKSGTVVSFNNLAREFRNVHFAPFIPKEKRAAFRIAEQILTGLRKFDEMKFQRYKQSEERIAKYKDLVKFWMFPSREHQISAIKEVLQMAEQIFASQPPMLEIESPCFFFGDIHGNIRDLFTFERFFWPSAPFFVNSRFVFLGDYVDRGDYGIECICYLFALKIIMPEQFILLRGNHEGWMMHQVYNFKDEILEKFGEVEGAEIYELCDKAFNQMPVCGVVDETIFCSHGGIPKAAPKLAMIKKITKPIPTIEEHPIATELLWNDFVERSWVKETFPDCLNGDGYIPNNARNQGHYVWDVAVDKYLKKNNLSLIVRAHELTFPGYRFNCRGKVITVFSTSYYCRLLNTAACLLADGHRVRLLQLETLND